MSAPKSPHPKTVILVGPTAVGKSIVAVELALRLDGEVIGLDSRQIYRHMAVGTAQPSEEARRGVPHHLIGIRDPSELISAGEYAELVAVTIDEVKSRGKVPIICGGSGLYFRALTRGLFEDSSSDLEVRAVLKERLEREGVEALLAELQAIDPEYAEIVHPNNHKRLIRALEIYEITGKPPTEHFRRQGQRKEYHRFFTAYIRMNLEQLASRIEERTQRMFAQGWVDEVKRLVELGFDSSHHAMESLGYRQILQHFDGELEFDEMVERVKIETRQFARKQMKWFDREEVDLVIDFSERTPADIAVEIEQAFKSV